MKLPPKRFLVAPSPNCFDLCIEKDWGEPRSLFDHPLNRVLKSFPDSISAFPTRHLEVPHSSGITSSCQPDAVGTIWTAILDIPSIPEQKCP